MSQDKREQPQCAVEREVFMRDPGAVVESAKANGPIAITDSRGEPMLHICIPTDVRPERIL